ncbi:hypothetical protein D3C73_1546730 [compost metagenome]
MGYSVRIISSTIIMALQMSKIRSPSDVLIMVVHPLPKTIVTSTFTERVGEQQNCEVDHRVE